MLIMASKLGENIQREWNSEPRATELWDALQLLKQDRTAGISLLTDLAEDGSGLAMMYLGHTLALDENDRNISLGEEWLIRSAEHGSTEGRYQLAHHHFQQRNWIKAQVELERLAQTGYSPAMYALGSILYHGNVCNRDLDRSVNYLKVAKEAGHLPSVGLLSQIYRKDGFGAVGQIISLWLRIASVPLVTWYIWRYPNSDRLRGLTA